MTENENNENRLLREELERRRKIANERASYEEFLIRKKQQRRQLVAMISAATVLAGSVLIYIFLRGSLESSFLKIAVIGGPILALASLTLAYLQSSPSSRTKSDAYESYARLRYYIDERLKDASIATQPTLNFNESDKAIILANIQAKLESDALQNYVAGIKELVTSRVKEDALEKLFDNIVRRLGQEVQDLARRGNLNLTLGILTTLVGLSVLGYSVFYSPATRSPQELISYFVPRVSLVVLIEIFAYFFLRLYKQSLSEIKYFQNEITNIESKQLALHITMHSDDAGLRGDVVKELSKTERNFILGKDQTTLDLERERLSKETYSDIANAVKEFMQRKS